MDKSSESEGYELDFIQAKKIRIDDYKENEGLIEKVNMIVKINSEYALSDHETRKRCTSF